MASIRQPDDINRPLRRLTGALAAGTATAVAGVQYEIIPVRGATRVRVRIKTATNGGTLDLLFAGPDLVVPAIPSESVAFASLQGTVYTSGNPAQVTVTAGTEATIASDCYGEGYAIVKFTGTVGAGTITYCDVTQV